MKLLKINGVVYNLDHFEQFEARVDYIVFTRGYTYNRHNNRVPDEEVADIGDLAPNSRYKLVKAIYKWLDEDEKDFFDGDSLFKS